MRVRWKPICVIAAAVALVGSCASTTVVERADRIAPDAASTADVEPSPTSAPADEPTQEPAADDSPDAGSDQDPAPTAAPDSGTGSDPSEGFGLGGADQIDGLIEDCEAGSDNACDILFQLSDFDSEEETLALLCGGRRDFEERFCTEGIEPDGDNLWFDDSSPALPQIVTDCEDGDMTACDFLFFRSAPGSEFEDIGNTCAGRTNVAVPDCRTFFAE